MPSRSKSLSLLCWLALGAPALYAGMALEVGKGGGALAFPHGNGRQIARSSSGLWFLAYDGQVDGAAAILLAGSRGAAPEVTGDFESAVVLVGKSPRALIRAEGELRRDARGRHVEAGAADRPGPLPFSGAGPRCDRDAPPRVRPEELVTVLPSAPQFCRALRLRLRLRPDRAPAGVVRHRLSGLQRRGPRAQGARRVREGGGTDRDRALRRPRLDAAAVALEPRGFPSSPARARRARRRLAPLAQRDAQSHLLLPVAGHPVRSPV